MSLFSKLQTTTSTNRKWIYTVILAIASPFTVFLTLLLIPYVWGYRLNLGKNKNSVERKQATSLEHDLKTMLNNLWQSRLSNVLAGLLLMFASQPRLYPYSPNATQSTLMWLSAVLGLFLFIRGLIIKTK